MSATLNGGKSHYATAVIAQEVHDLYGKSIRTSDGNSLVKKHFTHFRAIYDSNNRPTSVNYYRGIKQHVTNIQTKDANVLQSTYFVLHSAPSDDMYVVWFNVDGLGVAPVIPSAKLIEVEVSSSDNRYIVAVALTLTINNFAKDKFLAQRNGYKVQIDTAEFGVVTDSYDVSTTFILENAPGEQENVANITIRYTESGDPYFNGEVLKGYSYDIYAGRFVKLPTVSVGNVQIDTKTVSTPLIQNIVLANANTEYGVVLPLNTYSITVRVRSGKAQFSWTIGQSGSTFITLNPGVTYSETSLKLIEGKNAIYFQSPQPEAVLEIISWS